MGFYEVNLVVWPQKPQKLLLLTEPSVLTAPSEKTEDQDFSAEEFLPKPLPKITTEASAGLNFVLTLTAFSLSVCSFSVFAHSDFKLCSKNRGETPSFDDLASARRFGLRPACRLRWPGSSFCCSGVSAMTVCAFNEGNNEKQRLKTMLTSEIDLALVP